jgi:hypothetical protein
MTSVIDDELRWQWRPAVDMKYCPSQKIDKLGPVGIFVVISGEMKTEPRAAIFHIALKAAPLFFIGGRVIKPNHHLVRF